MENTQEIWKRVEGYPDYEVSSTGRVRSWKGRNPPRYLRLQNKKGYRRVVLSDANGIKNESVHRLVATAFLPKPPGKTVINHKDHIRDNNNVSNLEWVTPKENYDYSNCGEAFKNSKKGVPWSKKRRMYRIENVVSHETYICFGQAEAAGIIGCSLSNICRTLYNNRGFAIFGLFKIECLGRVHL